MVVMKILGLLCFAVSVVSLYFFRLLGQSNTGPITFSEGSLAFLVVTSLLAGIGIMWRQINLERRENREEIAAILKSHAEERGRIVQGATDRTNEMVAEYRERLDRLESEK